MQESGFFARDEPVLGLGASPELGMRTFTMNQGDVAGPIQTGRGFVFASLVAKQDAYVPKVDEVKERVRDEVVRNKAKEFGLKKANEFAARLKGTPDFEKAAQAAGFKAQTTELITRDSPIPDLGMAAQVTDAAFSLAQGTCQPADRDGHGQRRHQGAGKAGSRRRRSSPPTRTSSARTCSPIAATASSRPT